MYVAMCQVTHIRTSPKKAGTSKNVDNIISNWCLIPQPKGHTKHYIISWAMNNKHNITTTLLHWASPGSKPVYLE